MELYKYKMTDENGHSQFLVELLKNKIYLDSFLEVVEPNIKFNSDVKITFEEQADTTNSKGRVDIFLTDGTNTLLIENKINADDQENQLERYSDWANGQNLNFEIYYLSPYGSNPSEKGLGLLHMNQIKIISYSKHIREWLKKCLDRNGQYKNSVENYLKQWDNFLINDWSDRDKQLYKFFETISQRSKELCALQYVDEPVNESHMPRLTKGFFNLDFMHQDKGVQLIYDQNENDIFLRMGLDDFKSVILENEDWKNSNDNYDYIVCKVETIIFSDFDQVLSQSIERINNAFKDNY